MNAVFVHAGNPAVTGSVDGSAVVHPEKILQQFFVFPVERRHVFQLCFKVRIGQGKETGAGGDFAFFLCPDRLNGAAEGSGGPGVVDIQFSAAHPLAVVGGDKDLLPDGIGFVFHCDHNGAVQIGFHTAFGFGIVFKGHGDGTAGGQFHSFLQLYGHEPVQTQYGQGTVFQHDLLDAVTLFGKDLLDPAACSGRNGTADFFFRGIPDFLLEIFHGIGDFRNGRHNADRIHRSQRGSFSNEITVFYQEFRDFHTGRQRNVFHILGRQGAAAM